MRIRQGFSLIEVAASAVILAIMAGGVISLQSAQAEHAKTVRFEQDAAIIQEAVSCYLFFHGDETTLEDITMEALFRRGFLMGENRSPWGTPYKVVVEDGAISARPSP